MTKKQAKILALGHIISISDVTQDENLDFNDLPEKDSKKVYEELQNILDSLRDTLSNLENEQYAIPTRSL